MNIKSQMNLWTHARFENSLSLFFFEMADLLQNGTQKGAYKTPDLLILVFGTSSAIKCTCGTRAVNQSAVSLFASELACETRQWMSELDTCVRSKSQCAMTTLLNFNTWSQCYTRWANSSLNRDWDFMYCKSFVSVVLIIYVLIKGCDSLKPFDQYGYGVVSVSSLLGV